MLAVVGAGAWGTALANLCAREGREVLLWARDDVHVAEMAASRENRRRLPGVALAAGLRPTADLFGVARARMILAAVPAQNLRGILEALAMVLAPGVPVVICAKGIERGSGLFLSDMAGFVLPQAPLAVLSGPSFAQDVALGLPTAVTFASAHPAVAEMARTALEAPWFRLYHSTDMRGVEIGGAAKNVLAIACGIAAGRRLGASAGAALIARGFAELARLGRAYGARAETLMGLSGLGDLVLTCNSPQSRNFSFGLALGRGEGAGAALAEGAQTAAVLVQMARARGVEMPIASAVDAVLAGRIGVGEAIEGLLARPGGGEG